MNNFFHYTVNMSDNKSYSVPKDGKLIVLDGDNQIKQEFPDGSELYSFIGKDGVVNIFSTFELDI
ncbi:hypothetical protein D0499_05490 [Weissella soli]|uniref:hypothetical protein n=1 Tax=Weissella soli TaxID=155866 RepID=UPI0021BE433D|nr:hypothetical protein [Weissella soli]MCT8395263.1 hypothetical protein [Weissella soli]